MTIGTEERRKRPGREGQLGFAELRLANVERCETAFHMVKDWTPSDWMMAVTGELGEAANLLKKVRRGDYNIDDGFTRTEVAHELSDVVIYLDLLAAALDIDLGESVRRKFNIVSDRRGSKIRL